MFKPLSEDQNSVLVSGLCERVLRSACEMLFTSDPDEVNRLRKKADNASRKLCALTGRGDADQITNVILQITDEVHRHIASTGEPILDADRDVIIFVLIHRVQDSDKYQTLVDGLEVEASDMSREDVAASIGGTVKGVPPKLEIDKNIFKDLKVVNN